MRFRLKGRRGQKGERGGYQVENYPFMGVLWERGGAGAPLPEKRTQKKAVPAEGGGLDSSEGWGHAGATNNADKKQGREGAGTPSGWAGAKGSGGYAPWSPSWEAAWRSHSPQPSAPAVHTRAPPSEGEGGTRKKSIHQNTNPILN